MGDRIYPVPKMPQPRAAIAWFRGQIAANPKLFQSASPHILTLPSPRQPAHAKPNDVVAGLVYQEPRPQTAEPDVLSPAETIYWLRKCRYDRKPRVPITQLAAAAGLNRSTIYWAMRTGEASEATCAALTPILMAVRNDEIGFQRVNQAWEQVELNSEPPDPNQPPQPRVVPATDHRRGARCQVCGNPRFSPFTSDKTYLACDGCVSEPDRIMLGAR